MTRFAFYRNRFAHRQQNTVRIKNRIFLALEMTNFVMLPNYPKLCTNTLEELQLVFVTDSTKWSQPISTAWSNILLRVHGYFVFSCIRITWACIPGTIFTNSMASFYLNFNPCTHVVLKLTMKFQLNSVLKNRESQCAALSNSSEEVESQTNDCRGQLLMQKQYYTTGLHCY